MKKSVLLATAILAIGLSSNQLFAQTPTPTPTPTPVPPSPTPVPPTPTPNPVPPTPSPVPPPPAPPVPPTTPTPMPPQPPTPTPPVPPTPNPNPVPTPKRDTNTTKHIYGTVLNVGGKATLFNAFDQFTLAPGDIFANAMPVSERKEGATTAAPARLNTTI